MKSARSSKKAIICLIVLTGILFVMCLALSSLDVAFADNKNSEDIDKDLGQAIEEIIERLDFESLQKFLNSLGEDEASFLSVNNIGETIKSLTNGEGGNFFERLFEVLGKTFGRYFLSFLPSFITILIISILKSMLSGLTADFLDNSTTEVVHIVLYASIITVLMTGVVKIVALVVYTVNAMATFAEAVFPILLTLLSAVGGTATVATYSPMLAVLSNGIIAIIVKIIVPAFIAVVVFAVVGNLSKNVKLDKLTHLIKTASTWLIGVVFGLFVTFLTAQGITGGVVDKFGFNVAKFALSSYVPILGGYLSDGFDLISASIVVVKNAFGYFAAITVVGVVLFPLLKVLAFSLTLRFIAAIVEPIGDERVAKLLHTLAENMNLLITALAGVGFLFFIMLMLIIGSCNMGI
ncbi:MAG: stage III sporulation protein AE [Clostridia bacterium]|nr:stage III sporulation protein AE [Clostridia bacterium]